MARRGLDGFQNCATAAAAPTAVRTTARVTSAPSALLIRARFTTLHRDHLPSSSPCTTPAVKDAERAANRRVQTAGLLPLSALMEPALVKKTLTFELARSLCVSQCGGGGVSLHQREAKARLNLPPPPRLTRSHPPPLVTASAVAVSAARTPTVDRVVVAAAAAAPVICASTLEIERTRVTTLL